MLVDAATVAGRVHYVACPDVMLPTRAVGVPDPAHAIGVVKHAGDRAVLPYLGAGFSGIVQQDLVELHPLDLIGGRGRPRDLRRHREGERPWLLVRPHRNIPPRFLVNPASASASDAPIRRQIPCTVEGSNDSPIWYRGNSAFSRSSVLCPRIAVRDAKVEPPGPPPTTRTSKCSAPVVITLVPALSPPPRLAPPRWCARRQPGSACQCRTLA